MKIAIDIDGTITENLNFFKTFSNCRMFEIHILTGRPQKEKLRTIEELKNWGINYNYITFVIPKELNPNSKVNYCIENDIKVLIDDDDDYTINLPEDILLLKPRAKSNFNFLSNKWKNVIRYD